MNILTDSELSMALIKAIPNWYIAVAIAVSLYYGARGVVAHRIAADALNRKIAEEKGREWKKWEIIFVRYIQDFVFNFVCSMAGFVSLFFSYSIFTTLTNLSDIGVGTAILMIFLFLVGVIGISGQLPFLLLEGRLPSIK
jgi:hypothetical protein